jgi:hypothetical protein
MYEATQVLPPPEDDDDDNPGPARREVRLLPPVTQLARPRINVFDWRACLVLSLAWPAYLLTIS